MFEIYHNKGTLAPIHHTARSYVYLPHSLSYVALPPLLELGSLEHEKHSLLSNLSQSFQSRLNLILQSYHFFTISNRDREAGPDLF